MSSWKRGGLMPTVPRRRQQVDTAGICETLREAETILRDGIEGQHQGSNVPQGGCFDSPRLPRRRASVDIEDVKTMECLLKLDDIDSLPKRHGEDASIDERRAAGNLGDPSPNTDVNEDVHKVPRRKAGVIVEDLKDLDDMVDDTSANSEDVEQSIQSMIHRTRINKSSSFVSSSLLASPDAPPMAHPSLEESGRRWSLITKLPSRRSSLEPANPQQHGLRSANGTYKTD